MLVDFGKANPLEKARQQPDKVRQVLEKVKTDGLAPTLAAVRNKLEQPLPLGYCQVGVVVAAVGTAGDQALYQRLRDNGLAAAPRYDRAALAQRMLGVLEAVAAKA